MSKPDMTIFGVPFRVTISASSKQIEINPNLLAELLNSLPEGTQIIVRGNGVSDGGME